VDGTDSGSAGCLEGLGGLSLSPENRARINVTQRAFHNASFPLLHRDLRLKNKRHGFGMKKALKGLKLARFCS
jgi:hypothetical protein